MYYLPFTHEKERHDIQAAEQVSDDEPIGPELYGTGASTEDGQFIRRGWIRNSY
ncbi:hypothetical protein [Glutamicibacter creatinolyticus]|uniref:hypothetical protein n=1 Tax=Glutamicibacter creatinolyticus TaxID=162496 RepID=UPI001586E63C|nr:hypothetical protein [Glutamicibacter creatinolyticus]